MLGVYPDPVEMAHTVATGDEIRNAIAGGDQFNWFAVLDACDEPLVPQLSREMGKQAVCLYRGQAETNYWAIAPYLWTLTVERFDQIVERWGADPWGILIRTPNDLEQTRRHCRRFLYVEMPDGSETYFRFYDPRVLSSFLPSLTFDESREFYGNHLSFSCPTSADEYETFHLYRKENAASPAKEKRIGHSRSVPKDLDSMEYRHWLANRIGTALQRTQRGAAADVLNDQVARGISRAKSYGLSDPHDVGVYVEHVCCYLGGFTERPDPVAVQQVLTDQRYQIPIRVDRFVNLIRRQLGGHG